MKQTPKFNGEIVENEKGNAIFLADDIKSFLKHTKSLRGEKVTIIIKKYKPYRQRSDEENRYYWGVVVKILSDEFGYTSEEMHEVLKYQFLVKELESVNGHKRRVIGSTATSLLLKWKTI